MNQLIVWAIKCHEAVKCAYHISGLVLCPKPKYIEFAIIEENINTRKAAACSGGENMDLAVLMQLILKTKYCPSQVSSAPAHARLPGWLAGGLFWCTALHFIFFADTRKQGAA